MSRSAAHGARHRVKGGGDLTLLGRLFGRANIDADSNAHINAHISAHSNAEMRIDVHTQRRCTDERRHACFTSSRPKSRKTMAPCCQRVNAMRRIHSLPSACSLVIDGSSGHRFPTAGARSAARHMASELLAGMGRATHLVRERTACWPRVVTWLPRS